MAAVVDTVACMSPKSCQVGKEQRMMDKQRLGEEKDTGEVYGKAIYGKKKDIKWKQVERGERGQSHPGVWVGGF